ncbi:F-box domain [Cedratvirus A11]|uniref:F-box domain n=1 Tax=Cedratvirus A11 TaxID=1903266 RepID=A0A1M7XUU5_9VIRU|nr:F-box domain [Cedratvirus A11]SHO33350.1 F-box domain [Cedratvirus A11]
MSRLSLEVVFAILENSEVEHLVVLSSVDKEFRDVCESKTLWKRIFRKHCLTMLEENKSTSSWMANFNRSLSSKTSVDNFIYNILPYKCLYVSILDIDLISVDSASIIHIPGATNKDELEGLLIQNRLVTKIHPCTLCDFTHDTFAKISGKKKSLYKVAQGEGLYRLSVEKCMSSFYMSIKEFCTVHDWESKVHLNLKLNQEQLCLLLYKLRYHSLLDLSDKTLFETCFSDITSRGFSLSTVDPVL